MARVSEKVAGGANVLAFLDMLALAEIGATLLADPASDEGYRVLVGSTPARLTLFSDYAGHPMAHGRPINVRDGLYSTAAGRYQILARYWPFYARQLGLADFSPVSQDRYAIQQVVEQRALADVKAGRVRSAIGKCANIWASLPGAGYGQHEHVMTYLMTAFSDAGGTMAS